MLNEFISLVKGFALSKALMSALEMDLFPSLERPASRADLRKELKLSNTNLTDAFFDLLVAGGVLQEDNSISLTPLGRSVMTEYRSVKSWAQEMIWTYQALDYLTPALRSGGKPMARFWPYKSDQHCGDSDAYSTVMDESSIQLSQAIAEAHDFSQYDHVVDFGGGYGRLAITLAWRYPQLKVTTVDLPAVCSKMLIPEELQDCISIIPYDFFGGHSLSCGQADAALLVRVLHDWSDAQVAEILDNVTHNLHQSGHILVVEPMRQDPKPADVSDAVAGLMLACMGGKRRSVGQISEALTDAGCTNITTKDIGLSSYKIVVGELS
jgi:hypothetical protein